RRVRRGLYPHPGRELHAGDQAALPAAAAERARTRQGRRGPAAVACRAGSPSRGGALMSGRFEITLHLAGQPDEAHIAGRGAAWPPVVESESVHRSVHVIFQDQRALYGSSVSLYLTVEQSERTGRLLLELARWTREAAIPSDPRHFLTGRLTAWPEEPT